MIEHIQIDSLVVELNKLFAHFLDNFLSDGAALIHPTKQYKILYSLNETLSLLMQQNPEPPFFSYPDLITERDPLGYAFNKIINRENAKQAKDIFFDYFEQVVWKRLHDYLLPKGKEYEELIQFIYTDCMNYMGYKLSKRENDLFIEQQIIAYNSGYLPCGWEGNYPEGQLVVYPLLYNEKIKIIQLFIYDLELLLSKHRLL